MRPRLSGLLLALALVGPAATAAPPAKIDLFTHEDALDSGEQTAPAPAHAPGEPEASTLGQIPPEVLKAAEAARNEPLAQRMKDVAEPLLGKPYEADPLGEGQGYDPDPFARYDAFDCLTFVEEAVALALSGDPAHSATVRLGLRYDGTPAYATRHHFMELQWIPAALKNGWLRDTTADYGEVEHWHREVTPGVWRAWNRRGLFHLTDAQLPEGTMRLDILPLDAAMKVAATIRPGSILMAVRDDRSWIPLRITHLGLVVAGNDGPIFRHASHMSSGYETRDNRLSWYLEHMSTYVHWKTAGISLFEPVEFGPRLSRLPRQGGYAGPPPVVVLDDGTEAVATR